MTARLVAFAFVGVRCATVVLLAGCGRAAFSPLGGDAGDARDARDARDTAIAPDASPTSAVEIAAGGINTCVRLGSGEVWCWGAADQGGTGIGPTAATFSLTPMRIATTTPLVSLDTGDGGSCGRTATGGALCWGMNNAGQLGIGVTGATFSPMAVANETAIAEISVGLDLGCIRRTDGSAGCAGRAAALGDSSGGDRNVFGTIPGITTATGVTTGDSHGCALLADGSTRCWGLNDQGQLGDASLQSRTTAVPGPAGPYTAIAAGDKHTCALRGGVVDCWGAGDLGQLGDGQRADSSTPLQVANLVDAIAIAAAAQASCALRVGGSVVCWGGNQFDELGDASGMLQPSPVPVRLLDDAIAISARTGLHICALRASYTVWCWGLNDRGQLGRITDMSTGGEPGQVMGLPTP